MNYSEEVKREAKAFANNGIAPKEIATQMGVPLCTVRRWVRWNWEQWKDENKPDWWETKQANSYIKKNGKGGFLEWLSGH
jgi:transposase-like protein